MKSFNRFSQWIGFGNHRGVFADNGPSEQERAMKFNTPPTNAVIFHNARPPVSLRVVSAGRTVKRCPKPSLTAPGAAFRHPRDPVPEHADDHDEFGHAEQPRRVLADRECGAGI
ncbi:transposase [Streptomyces sp. NBC_00053]|uniref:hypothetical protein n=1 Tax=unclassified Streptomyces TaxID=2593676 RepID=UPI00224DC6B1|nr:MULTISPECIES: hypothetical protein [unclassified Streptomyces]MCX5098365.1 transposase [Streptomyces sp. NBC_00439]MCX5498222.1 transposase [Streptomyces sp. NBC_00052]MCX5553246.1 transposase [Streptomyces sp. NBC_00051]WSC25635.1 transposase [Streptomyces sp. NBC_01768]